MKWLLPVSFIALLAIGCSGTARREVSVRDVTKSEVFILKKLPDQGSVFGITVVGRGSVDGKAEVALVLDGATSQKELISGKVSFEWRADWYADHAEVRYISGTASQGSLTLQYEFADL